MSTHIPLRCTLRLALLLTTLPSGTSLAQVADFRVAFGNVPEIDMIQAGRYEEAIGLLEARQAQAASDPLLYELTTLCALYVLTHDIGHGQAACDAAVEREAAPAAYNNRGVFRVYAGDLAGAREDFSRVRVPPPEVATFVESLKRSDPRLMASNNFAALNKKARRHADEPTASPALGAQVEDMFR